MDKKAFYIILAVIVAIGLRLWNFDPTSVAISTDYIFTVPNDIYDPLFSNAFAPFYPYCMRFLSFVYAKILPYVSIVFDVLSVILMYFCILQIKTKKNPENMALLGSFFVAISTILIFFAKQTGMMSALFFLGTLLVFFSLRIINGSKNWWGVVITSILLTITYNLSIFFALFNTISLFIFSQKKKKSLLIGFCVFIGIIILILPFVPYILDFVKAPEYMAKYSLKLNFEQIAAYLTNMYSPQLNMGGTYKIQSVGSWIFVAIPTLICALMTIKTGLTFKPDTNYLTVTILCTFLSVISICAFGSEVFLSKYLLTSYPLLIVSVAYGMYSLKSNPTRIFLITVFATTTLFYEFVTNLIHIKLF